MSALKVTLGPARFEPGCWQGMRQPAVLAVLDLGRLEVAAACVQCFDALVIAALAPQSADVVQAWGLSVSSNPVIQRLMRLTLGVLQAAGMPIMGGAAAVSWGDDPARQWVLGLPAVAEGNQAPQAALGLACALWNALAQGLPVDAAAVRTDIQKLSHRFRPLAPGGVNTLQFLQAAHDLQIPWRHIDKNVYQFGWGRRSRWLDSSFTDGTSVVSAGLARDKVSCAKVLREAGLPVPQHHLVNSAQQAVQMAQSLGFPVVVKPANLDGGKGVLAGLHHADAVARAFEVAVQCSPRVLVEKFIEGQDYRIRVCQGEVIGVVIRKPASVLGDGVQTVRALVAHTNRVRAQSVSVSDPAVEQGFRPIVVDDEVLQWLQAQGLGLDDVAAAGRAVRLRGAANVSLGGTTWEVGAGAHPDNLALAVLAAAALRLDVAGVDLLLPDMAQSWKETGGAVCEVNAQPQFSSGPAHHKVLQRLVHRQGRIPFVALQAGVLAAPWVAEVQRYLKTQGLHVHWAQTRGQCQQALRRADVDAVLWQMDRWLSPGVALPVDRVDVLVHDKGPLPLVRLAAWGVRASWDVQALPEPGQLARRLTAFLAQSCAPMTQGET